MIRSIFFMVAMIFTQQVMAEWALVNHKSYLNFITTKNGEKTEVHKFSNINSSISQQGNVVLTIDLASVETHIPIRNKRIREMFFQVNQYPKAEISFKLNEKQLQSLEEVGLNVFEVTAKCNLHGIQKDVSAQIRVAVLPDNEVLVTTVKPIIFSISDYGLLDGLNKLREVAKLKSITPSVPVTLNLVYKK